LGQTRRGPFWLRRHVAVPSDHGSWVFLAGPLLIGLFAAGRFRVASVYLIGAALCAFLARQPITIAVKSLTGRRSRDDLGAALLWIAVYGTLAVAQVAALARLGFYYLLYLLVPAVPVFVWYLVLVARRAERRRLGVEVLASGALALSAPASLWVGSGSYDSRGWLLWVLVWAQSGASIVYAYLRLEQRAAGRDQASANVRRRGLGAASFASADLVAVLVLGLLDVVPPALGVPYAVQWVEVLWGIRHPATGLRPRAIGLRQLVVSCLFTVLFVTTWR
jgi:hypothetical protein